MVLWDTRRGDRELESWARFLTLCRNHGTLIHVTSEDYTYDVARRPRDWKALASAGVDAAADSDEKSVAVTSGKRFRASQGVPQGTIAYGIIREWDPTKPKLNWLRDYPNPETAPVARRIILAAGAGESWAAIAAALDADGIPTPSGTARWNVGTIKGIAANPVYALRGVVTEAESAKARARVSDPARKGERASRQAYRYGKIMRCGICGTTVRGITIRGDEQYRCLANHGGLPGQGNAISASEADAYLDALAVEFIATRASELITDDNSDAARWETEAAGYRQQLAEAAASFAAGRIPISALEAVSATLVPKAEAAEERARAARIPGALSGLPDEDRAVVSARWVSLTTAARKAALRVIMPDVTLQPGGRDVLVSERIIPWPAS